ncbi:MAG: hypothetical protein AB1487_10805 [Thermodesulfobacteriota bacterium]
MPKYPFEVPFNEILGDSERYVDAVFSCLESEFLVMPKGVGFVEYPVFERGYEALKTATKGFSELEPVKVLPVTLAEPISIVILRTMLGFTPPEWGYLATQRTGVSVTQGFVRSLDRKVRMSPENPLNANGVTKERLKALVETACFMLTEGTPQVEDDQLHRLNKADTKRGIDSIKNIAGWVCPTPCFCTSVF